MILFSVDPKLWKYDETTMMLLNKNGDSRFFQDKLWTIPCENEEGLIQEKSVKLSESALTLNNGEFGYFDTFF